MKNNINIYEIMERLEAVLSPYPHPLMLHEPCFEGNEWEYTKQCLDSGWVSSAGKYVEKFEQHLADFTGVKQAVALVNGTAALHLSLLLAGVKAGEEVLLPALLPVILKILSLSSPIISSTAGLGLDFNFCLHELND